MSEPSLRDVIMLFEARFDALEAEIRALRPPENPLLGRLLSAIDSAFGDMPFMADDLLPIGKKLGNEPLRAAVLAVLEGDVSSDALRLGKFLSANAGKRSNGFRLEREGKKRPAMYVVNDERRSLSSIVPRTASRRVP